MKSAFCCLLLLATGLAAQSTAKLDADLTLLANPGASANAVTQQIADDILTLAEKDAQPSRQSVLDFSNELAKAMAMPGKTLPAERAELLAQAIVSVLQSSGASSSRFHAMIDSFRNTLIALNATPAQAKGVSDRLFILGQEVRGPEDIPTLTR
jgi:hypothetical protein